MHYLLAALGSALLFAEAPLAVAAFFHEAY
jgi:hypothetical protein